MPELGSALTEVGRLADAESLLDSAVEIAARRGDALAEAHATVAQLGLRLQVDTEAGTREVRDRFEPLLETLEQARDDLGLGRLWRSAGPRPLDRGPLGGRRRGVGASGGPLSSGW